MRLNNYKNAHKSFKIKKRETQTLFQGYYIQDNHEGKSDWQFAVIVQCTTNAELTLNLGKERFISNVLKRSFEIALMSVKNLVYNELGKQYIFCFINSILVLVVLTYCHHSSSSCSSYYYYYEHYFY